MKSSAEDVNLSPVQIIKVKKLEKHVFYDEDSFGSRENFAYE